MTTTPLKPVRKELTFGFAVFILTVVVAIIASGMMFYGLKLQMLMLSWKRGLTNSSRGPWGPC